MFKATVLSEFSRVPTRRASTVHLLIKLETAPMKRTSERLPLNLSLVLDRSGSMSGEKLRFTRQAAKHLVSKLQKRDTVSVVVYDDRVDVLSPPVSGAEKQRLDAAVSRVEARGMTNLSAGWLSGLALTQRGASQGVLSRVLLMTDGLANEGVTDAQSLVGIGRDYLGRGIRTTTLGFGADFNEDLLTAIADEAGGNFHYIDSPDKAPAVFLEELGELTTVVGQNLEVVLGCEPGVTVDTSYSKFPGVVGDREAVWRLGDLYADDQRLLLVSVNVPAGFPAGRSPVAQVGVRYHQVRGGVGERRHELPAMLAFADVTAACDSHPEVMRERLVMSAARAKEQAIAQADRGEFERAQATLRSCTGSIRSRLNEAHSLPQEDVALLGAEAGLCDELMTGFSRDRYSKLSRKQAMVQAMMAKKQRGVYRK